MLEAIKNALKPEPEDRRSMIREVERKARELERKTIIIEILKMAEAHSRIGRDMQATILFQLAQQMKEEMECAVSPK